MPLKTLTYTSLARLDLTASDLSDIHETARHINALEGITGLLIFNGVRFLQVIEGGEAAIDSLVARLRNDHRHSAFEVRDEAQIEERSFGNWSMELFHVSTDRFEARDEVESALPATIQPEVRQHVLRMTDTIGRVSLAD